ncbi:hypothetical protein D1872_311880 [compost metagenome]
MRLENLESRQIVFYIRKKGGFNDVASIQQAAAETAGVVFSLSHGKLLKGHAAKLLRGVRVWPDGTAGSQERHSRRP